MDFGAETDALDRRILNALQEDASRGVAQLAEAVGSSPATCHRRIRALRDKGVIERVVARCASASSREPVTVMLGLTLVQQTSNMQRDTRNFLRSCDEVRCAWLTTGDYDYMAIAVFEDLAHLNRFSTETLSEFAPIARYRTFLALEELKFETARRF